MLMFGVYIYHVLFAVSWLLVVGYLLFGVWSLSFGVSLLVIGSQQLLFEICRLMLVDGCLILVD